MLKYFQSEWTALALGNIAYVVVLMMTFQGPPPEAEEEPATPKIMMNGKSWEFENPEIEHLIEELKSRKTALDQREIDLNEMASRLRAEKAEITRIEEKVQSIQDRIDKNVLRIEAAEIPNLKKMAKTYSLMEPAAAAAGLRAMEDDSIAKVLRVMKQAEAAPILEILGQGNAAAAKRVSYISERMRLAVEEPATTTPANTANKTP